MEAMVCCIEEGEKGPPVLRRGEFSLESFCPTKEGGGEMSKRAFVWLLVIALFVQVGVRGAEAPKLALRIPEDAVAAVFIRDLPALGHGKPWMSSLSEVFPGEVAIALLEIPEKEEPPQLVIMGEVNPEKLRWFLTARLKPILRRNLGKVEFDSVEDITDIVVNDSPTAFYAVKGDMLWFSLDRECLADLLSKSLAAENSLRSNSLFAKVLRRTSPTSRSVFFVNVKRILEAFGEKIPERTRQVLKSIGVLDIEAVGGGDEIIDGANVGSLSLITSGRPGGFLSLAAQAPAGLTTARYVPGDYSLYARLRFSNFSEACEQVKATLGQVAGEEAVEGIADFLEMFRETTGFDFEEDLLGSLGGEVAIAVAVPERLRIPDGVALLEVKNRAKVEKIIGKMLPGPAGETHTYEDVTIRTARVGPLMAAYGFVDEYLVLGTDVSVVKSVVEAANDGRALTENPAFRSAFGRLGEGGHVLYLDIGSALPLYLSAISHAAAQWTEDPPSAGFEPPTWETMGKVLMSPLLTDVILACSVSGDEESVTLRGYSTFSGTYRLMAGSSVMAGMMLPALSRARESARRAACLNNLKQLVLAEKMYSADHQDKFSERLSDLYPDYVTSLEVFTCPSAGAPTITRKEDIDSLTSYVLRKGLTEAVPSDEVLIYEKPGNHPGEGGNVAYVDGHVKWLRAYEFVEIIDKNQTE